MAFERIHFVASPVELAEEARARLVARHGQTPVEEAEVIVALGGDGLMLSTLHATGDRGLPVYGMNRGTVGFLMNAYRRGAAARAAGGGGGGGDQPAAHARDAGGRRRSSRRWRSTRSRSCAPGRRRRSCASWSTGASGWPSSSPTGRWSRTPAGSTAYNYSAHGPILPIGADILALTPMAAFRPRRWRGALLPKAARVAFEVIEADKRPVSAVADSTEVRDAVRIEVASAPDVAHRILFDPGHGLEERLIREQFV